MNSYLNSLKKDSIHHLEYMGSAEFEWGALPSALRALESIKDSLVFTTENSLTDDSGSSLRVMHGFNQQDYDEYIGYLKLMREDIGVIMLLAYSLTPSPNSVLSHTALGFFLGWMNWALHRLPHSNTRKSV